MAAPMTAPSFTFGDRLRRARRNAGLSQAEMAARLDVTPSRYGGWESDAARPWDIVDVARRVAEATDVPASWLLGVDSSGIARNLSGIIAPRELAGGTLVVRGFAPGPDDLPGAN